VTTAIIVALIAATPGVLGAILGYLNARAIRRQTATENAVPLGRLLEQVDRKVDRLTDNVVDLRERMARLEGWASISSPGGQSSRAPVPS
jgi:hypothetical protein